VHYGRTIGNGWFPLTAAVSVAAITLVMGWRRIKSSGLTCLEGQWKVEVHGCWEELSGKEEERERERERERFDSR
jgi:hypothetical protein